MECSECGRYVRQEEVATEYRDLVPKHHILQCGVVAAHQLGEVDDAAVDQLGRVNHLGDLRHRPLAAEWTKHGL